MNNDHRFRAAMDRFDAANAQDPRRVSAADGSMIATEVLYAQRMSEWLGRLYPQASEALRLAARAQHIRRWEIPRERYPMDRAGYHRWRTTLYRFHAETADQILRDVGYDAATIGRVSALLQKQRLKADPEMQALEDVICLVFLESYFADFAPKHDDEKVVTILRRTWAKMSPIGRGAAMKLELPATLAELVTRAVNGAE